MDENKPTNHQLRDLYQEATNRIIAAIEAGTSPWQKPWTNVATGPLRNGATGNAYHGINTVMLYCAALERNFTDPRWLSFKQCQTAGYKIKKGAKSERVYFYKPMMVDEIDKASGKPVIDAATGKPRQREIPFLQSTAVFNTQEIENIPPLAVGDMKFSPIDAGEEIMKRCPVEIRYGGNSAHYSPASDTIAMPKKGQFNNPEDFYATLAHEMIHSTGHPSRCNREFGKRFGDEKYGMEELCAEIGSFQLAMETSLPSKPQNHASYIEHWLTVLKTDKKALFIAAAKSSQAVDFVMGRPAYDARAEVKEAVKTEAPQPVAAKPSLPPEIAAPASEALSAVSAKMKKMREKRKGADSPPPSPGGMRM
jgi:antirestriction protein ArdC